MAECCTVATMIIFLYLWGYLIIFFLHNFLFASPLIDFNAMQVPNLESRSVLYSRIQVEHSLQIDKDTPQFKIFTRINK